MRNVINLSFLIVWCFFRSPFSLSLSLAQPWNFSHQLIISTVNKTNCDKSLNSSNRRGFGIVERKHEISFDYVSLNAFRCPREGSFSGDVASWRRWDVIKGDLHQSGIWYVCRFNDLSNRAETLDTGCSRNGNWNFHRRVLNSFLVRRTPRAPRKRKFKYLKTLKKFPLKQRLYFSFSRFLNYHVLVVSLYRV